MMHLMLVKFIYLYAFIVSKIGMNKSLLITLIYFELLRNISYGSLVRYVILTISVAQIDFYCFYGFLWGLISHKILG